MYFAWTVILTAHTRHTKNRRLFLVHENTTGVPRVLNLLKVTVDRIHILGLVVTLTII